MGNTKSDSQNQLLRSTWRRWDTRARGAIEPSDISGVCQHLFPLKQMLAFLSNAVNRIYEVREIVYIPDG